MARICILALFLFTALVACSAPAAGPSTSSPSHGSSPVRAVSSAPSLNGFPSQAAGLPVIDVAAAARLLRSGQLDGRAVAVAGYYDQFTPPCPYPGRYIGPLESWCRFVAFTDSRATAQLCRSDGPNGMGCSLPTGTNLAPFVMAETSGVVSPSLTAGQADVPAAVVLVGHAGDPRQWQCTAATQADCADALVVDRVAWANGQEVALDAPQVSRAPITPRMTLADVSAAIGPDETMLTAAALSRSDVATIDPRWNFTGEAVLWLVRSLGNAPATGAGEILPETVWLVDDATGQVMDSLPLKSDPDYRPARLWEMATAHGVDCCAGNELAFSRVTRADGTVEFDGMVPGGSSGGPNATTFGGSYGSGPLVLPPGDYEVSAWLAPFSNGVAGAHHGECSRQVSLGPLGDLSLNADFPPGNACTIGPAPGPSQGA